MPKDTAPPARGRVVSLPHQYRCANVGAITATSAVFVTESRPGKTICLGIVAPKNVSPCQCDPERPAGPQLFRQAVVASSSSRQRQPTAGSDSRQPTADSRQRQPAAAAPPATSPLPRSCNCISFSRELTRAIATRSRRTCPAVVVRRESGASGLGRTQPRPAVERVTYRPTPLEVV